MIVGGLYSITARSTSLVGSSTSRTNRRTALLGRVGQASCCPFLTGFSFPTGRIIALLGRLCAVKYRVMKFERTYDGWRMFASGGMLELCYS